MKLTKFTLSLVAILTISACTTGRQQASFEEASKEHQSYQEITKQYQINEEWWKGYNDPELDRLVNRALANNVDLAKAAIAVNMALYNANLVGADLIPTFTGNGQSSASKGIGKSDKSSVSTGTSRIEHQLGFNLSYTLDLWGRLRDATSAAEWEKEATEQDLQAARLSLINAVVSTYYNLAYYRDAIVITEKSIKAYEQINRILTNQFKAGLIDELSVAQSQQSILSARNTMINLKSAQKVADQTLRNLLNLAPNQPLAIHYPNLSNVKLQGVDVNVPVSAIANRPDLNARLYRLKKAFKNLSAMEKSWYPTLTLGASLSSRGAKVGDIDDNPAAGGLVSFTLPFLDWNRVKNNVNLSEEQYKLAKLDYTQTITSALNEIDGYYYAYTQAKDSYKNMQKKYNYDKKISNYYQQRYQQGIAELRVWLNALNTERASELTLLQDKYNLIKNENAVYQAMAGKYQR
ncbi:TolC family protein [Otariodibacter sp.]|uniref:toxin/drug exporter TdeA n=1 Tax=Otariodibacter sp. TaxID=3030919 RepID=UPI00262CA2EB|nr:TolC family protein [Otariodibacter sp.]